MTFALAVFTLFDHSFMRNAFLATTFLAPACGLVGYFVVIRNEVFAGDALSHVAFTGALGALAFGVSMRWGLFGSTIAFAAILGVLGNRARVGDVTIGALFTWVLGLGVFFLALFTASSATSDSQAGPQVLFGSVFGISQSHAMVAAASGAIICVLMVAIARPLLFASIDVVVATARGVRTRALSIVFMVILGLMVAEVSQIVGALLLLGLIATPAATAHRLTTHPYRAMWLSAALCLADVWIGLTVSYLVPSLPPSFALIALAFGLFVGVLFVDFVRSRSNPTIVYPQI